jgi:hypothetical protein
MPLLSGHDPRHDRCEIALARADRGLQHRDQTRNPDLDPNPPTSSPWPKTRSRTSVSCRGRFVLKRGVVVKNDLVGPDEDATCRCDGAAAPDDGHRDRQSTPALRQQPIVPVCETHAIDSRSLAKPTHREKRQCRRASRPSAAPPASIVAGTISKALRDRNACRRRRSRSIVPIWP